MGNVTNEKTLRYIIIIANIHITFIIYVRIDNIRITITLSFINISINIRIIHIIINHKNNNICSYVY